MVLGIDIGGTTITCGTIKDGKVLSRFTAPSFSLTDTFEQTIQKLESLIEYAMVPDVTSIGIGVPSVVDAHNGIVFDTVNIPSWKEVHLSEILGNRFGIPVNVNNDANCYTLGAAMYSNGCPDEIVVGITLGTGVGMGLVVNGRIVNGRNTGVGEISCLPFRNKTYEDFCSRKFFDDLGFVPKELAAKAEDGDSEAVEVFRSFGRNLAELVRVAILAYDPNRIIFGGGIANGHGLFHDAMMERLEEIFPYKESLKNLYVEYKPQVDYALIGASLV